MTHSSQRRIPAPYALLLSALLSCAAHAATGINDGDAVVASQGGAKVTFADIDAVVQRVPESERAHFVDSPKRIEGLITNLLLQGQLAAAARAHGLDKDPDVLKAKNGPTDEVLAKAELARFKAEIVEPDFGELAQEEYIAHKDKYSVPAILDVQHVLISSASRSDEEARKLADQVEAQARKDPAQFDALVEKYSDDPSKASDKGLVQHADNERYDRAFTSAAKALTQPGDISPVVKTAFGYHVLKLVAKAPAQQKGFEQVREGILATLRKNYMEKTMKGYIDTLRNKPLDANEERVASLRTRYGMAPRMGVQEAPRPAKP